MNASPTTEQEIVLEAQGLSRGSYAPALQTFLLRQPGVLAAEANPFGEAVTVRYDPRTISPPRLRALIDECGYHCRGEALPYHVCAPEPGAPAEQEEAATPDAHAGHVMAHPPVPSTVAPTMPPEHA